MLPLFKAKQEKDISFFMHRSTGSHYERQGEKTVFVSFFLPQGA